MSVESKYQDMIKAEKKVKAYKKKYNYHYVKTKCCATCVYSYQELEDSRRCSRCKQQDWLVNDVDNIGVCDNYKAR